MSAAAPARRRRGAAWRVLTGPVGRTVLTVGVIVAVFVGVLPRIADYSQAWELVRSMAGAEIALVAAVAAANVVSYAPLWVAATPGLAWWRALMADLTSTTISNTVPAGFAFGLGTTAAMFHSYGLPAGSVARAITLTGLWNNLVKLAMPAVALAGLLLVGDVPVALAVASLLGAVLVAVALGGLVLVLTHGAAGNALAGAAERASGRFAGRRGRPAPSGWVARTDRFRTDSLELLRHRWGALSAAALVSHGFLFLVLLVCLRAVDGEGSDLHWVIVLAVFSVTRLVTLVQVTPGAIGVAELSYVAGLTAAGVGGAAAAGAVLLFRFLTWFVPIPLGAVAWLLWRRGVGRAAPGRPTVPTAG